MNAVAMEYQLFYLFSMQVEELGRLENTVIYRHLGSAGAVPVPGVKIMRFLAPLFFANCSVLKVGLPQ